MYIAATRPAEPTQGPRFPSNISGAARNHHTSAPQARATLASSLHGVCPSLQPPPQTRGGCPGLPRRRTCGLGHTLNPSCRLQGSPTKGCFSGGRAGRGPVSGSGTVRPAAQAWACPPAGLSATRLPAPVCRPAHPCDSAAMPAELCLPRSQICGFLYSQAGNG